MLVPTEDMTCSCAIAIDIYGIASMLSSICMLLSVDRYSYYNMNIVKNQKKLMIVLTVFLSAVFLSLVWNNNVWMDEAFTASLVHTDFRGVIDRSMADTLPPLYNIILKIMTAVFGYKIPVMKITSVIPMILTLIVGATEVRKRFGLRTAVLFMVYITFMPLFLYYGVEIRMYSLGFFFATASGVYAYSCATEGTRRGWIVFTVISTLAGYSHHFAFVTVAFAYLYLLLYFIFFEKKRIKEWLWCLLATFVMYLPCLIVTIGQFSRVSGYFSMPDIDLPMFIQYALYQFVVGKMPVSIICGLSAAVALFIFAKDFAAKKDRGSERIFGICSFTVYYGVLIFGTAVCAVMTANIFVDRYLFFAAGLLWLFVAIVLGSRPKSFAAALAVAAFIGVFTYSSMFTTEYGNTADEEIAFLKENVREGDVYYSIGGHEEMQNCIPFYTYLDEDQPELEFVSSLDVAIERAKERNSTVWVSVLEGFEPSGEDLEILDRNGFIMQKASDFEFDRYRCEFYRLTR